MRRLSALLFVAILAAAGCNDSKTTTQVASENTKIKAALDKLSPEDRALAESQRTCPISNQPLGSMGAPIKLVLNDKTVFVCCESCEKPAKADPDGTLKKLEALKSQAGSK